MFVIAICLFRKQNENKQKNYEKGVNENNLFFIKKTTTKLLNMLNTWNYILVVEYLSKAELVHFLWKRESQTR